jgi:SAM-dependent methyltransferase
MEDVGRGFERLGPWVTQFAIGGRTYGGHFDAMNDVRVGQFFQAFGAVRSILELGSLEGGHSFAFATHPEVARVVAVEGREPNVKRAEYVKALLSARKVDFLLANLESTDLAELGRFDAVFCVGLLYHLPEPWKLVEQMARVSSRVFVWTHYTAEDKAIGTLNGYRGGVYRENGLGDPLSGMSPASFWPTLPELRRMLGDHGFTQVDLIEDDARHPHGPCVTLSAANPFS